MPPEVLVSEIRARGLVPSVLKFATKEQLEEALRGHEHDQLMLELNEAICC